MPIGRSVGRVRSKTAAIDGSINFGVYRVDSGEQVAYARVVTDRAMFAWICDVYVDRSVRGQGVGKAMMEAVIRALEVLDVWRLVLVTGDAHGLYARFGFETLESPESWLTKVRKT